MALNPPLTGNDRLPKAITGEIFLMSRKGMGFSATIDGFGRFSASGQLFVTTYRLVFVAKSPSTQNGILFRAFDIPIRLVENERFNQPIFGANNMTGKVQPMVEAGLLVPAQWRLVFKEGGVGTFLPIFLRMMDQFRKAVASGDTSWQDGAGAKAFYQQVQSKAYVDPSDPSTIFVAQPTADG